MTVFLKLVNIFGKVVHSFRDWVHIFGKLVHIFAWKLVSRTSKQVLRNLFRLWQPGFRTILSLGCPGFLLLGSFFASVSEIKKSENQKIKKWSLRNDFRAGTTPAQITEIGSAENSLFEGHEVIWISVTRQLPAQITEMLRPRNFRFSETFRDSSVLVGQR